MGALAACLLTGCFGGGGGIPKANGGPVKDPEAGHPVVLAFEALSKLGDVKGEVEKAFLAADFYRRAFDLRAAKHFPEFSDRIRRRLERFRPLLKNPSGRSLLDAEARLLHFVVLESRDPGLRAASLSRLVRVFREKAADPDLRSMRVGERSPEKDAVMQAVYARLACVFARAYDLQTRDGKRGPAEAVQYRAALKGLLNALRKEFREGLQKRLRLAEEDGLWAISVEAPVPRLVQEAVEKKDRAVMEKAERGSAERILGCFLDALAYFAFAFEVASPELRDRYRAEFAGVPLILQELLGR